MANTGNKIYNTLLKVSSINNAPLDINDELCSVTGLQQASKPNVYGDPNYISPAQDFTLCPIPVNCELSEWSAWSICSNGTRTRTRTVITPASGGGVVCGPLSETESCLPDPVACNAVVTSGGTGISDYSLVMDNPNGGVITFDFNAQSVPDKLEILHALPSNVFVKKATSSMDAANNSTSFDNVYGTRPDNVIPSNNVSNIPQFIGSAKGAVPTRYDEYVAATGITNLPFTSGMQQRVWWVYSAADYAESNQVSIRVTGDVGTAWNFTRVCPVENTAVNCELSAWSDWSSCAGGTQSRTRTIITPASNGGTVCGPTSESRDCAVEGRIRNISVGTIGCQNFNTSYIHQYWATVYTVSQSDYIGNGEILYNNPDCSTIYDSAEYIDIGAMGIEQSIYTVGPSGVLSATPSSSFGTPC